LVVLRFPGADRRRPCCSSAVCHTAATEKIRHTASIRRRGECLARSDSPQGPSPDLQGVRAAQGRRHLGAGHRGEARSRRGHHGGRRAGHGTARAGAATLRDGHRQSRMGRQRPDHGVRVCQEPKQPRGRVRRLPAALPVASDPHRLLLLLGIRCGLRELSTGCVACERRRGRIDLPNEIPSPAASRLAALP
jgi:hypothetical protein